MKTKCSCKNFFILGFPRSGTTLLRLLLDSHSKIAIPFESFVLVDFKKKCDAKYYNFDNYKERERLVNDLINSKGISKWQPKIELNDINFKECNSYSNTIDQIFSSFAKKSGKQIWADKTPSYSSEMHELSEMFPLAKFVHIIRDGRDVALSNTKQKWGPASFSLALKQWQEVVSCTRKMGRMLPKDRYLEIRFEDLIFSSKEVLIDITGFLGVRFEKMMIERFNEKISTKIPNSSYVFHKNITQSINKGIAYKWKNIISIADQTISNDIAGSLFKELGYSFESSYTPRIFLYYRKLYHAIWEMVGWRFKKYNRFK